MWNSLEKAAKKATENAKKFAENEKVKSMSEKVKAQTKVMAEHGKKVTDSVKVKTQALGERVSMTKKGETPAQNAGNKDERPVRKIVVDASIGDMSEITWTDGSIKRMPSIRVFGKNTTIRSADEMKVVPRGISEDDENDSLVGEEAGDNAIVPSSTSAGEEGKSKVKLPVLIFPGMASSGLYVENSGLDNDKYAGRRVWMDAAFVASSMMDSKIVNPAQNEENANSDRYVESGDDHGLDVGTPDTVEEGIMPTGSSDSGEAVEFAKKEEELHIRSAWLYHISLDKNLVDERPGNRVRPYDGIKACEWLVDDALGKPAAVVWADVIKYLEVEMGYVRGKNLDAAPYDWRLPPHNTEARDGYLTKTMQRVEVMVEENDGLPIVMCCHSMGCKMGHYFLNFCLKEKGREWIDRHIHTYMPVGAPHCGAETTVRLGATGTGLLGFVDDHMLSLDEGLIMYRSWGSGPWLIPRELPPGALPPCIVRREGELGISINSSIDVSSLFAEREKPPKELRLTIIYRRKIRASTDYVPLVIKNDTTPPSMMLSFNETFYLAVPYLEDEDELGDLVFYLEEPSGRLYSGSQSGIRQQVRNATQWARGFKKEFTKLYRSFAKSVGAILRVAVCQGPLHIKASDFLESTSSTIDGVPVVESVIPFCKCHGGNDAEKILHEYDDELENEDDDCDTIIQRSVVSTALVDIEEPSIGSLSVLLSYSPPPDFSKGPSLCTTNFAVVSEDTPTPPVVSIGKKSNTISPDKIVYDGWNGRDLLDKDGFCKGMFDVNEEYYEQDPLGPSTKSSLDAPPVNIVRSIYGINVPTEVSAVYKKMPVVTIGDSKADSRFKIDKSAAFKDAGAEAMVEGYELKDGIIRETPETLQNVPGTTEKRRCCGDGTVPYWSLVHCLTWKDSIPDVTVDELEGAVHRPVLSDERFHALLKQYATVDDPRLPHSSGDATAVATLVEEVPVATMVGSQGEASENESSISGIGLRPIDASSLRSYV